MKPNKSGAFEFLTELAVDLDNCRNVEEVLVSDFGLTEPQAKQVSTLLEEFANTERDARETRAARAIKGILNTAMEA